MAPLLLIEPPKEAADCVEVPERGMDAVPRCARLCKRLVQAGFKVRTRVLTDLARSNKRKQRRGVDRAPSTVVFDAALVLAAVTRRDVSCATPNGDSPIPRRASTAPACS